MASKCVHSIIEVLGLTDAIESQLDWATIESSIGISLASDYKFLVEKLPPGRFQGFVGLLSPASCGDSIDAYLNEIQNILNDMRDWREEEPDRFPLPIHPEPGGLLPWGRSHRGDPFFWLTDSKDPNSWPVVATEAEEYSFWIRPPLGICEFLTEVLNGRFDGSRYGVDLSDNAPWYESAEQAVAERTSSTGTRFWLDKQPWPIAAGTEVAELERRLGDPPRHRSPIDWHSVETSINVHLPSDYKAFVDRYGAGVLGELTIAAPGGSRGGNLTDLIEELEIFAATNTKRQDRHRRQWEPPIHPEAGGLIPWGRTSDRQMCCWAPSGSDPDSWGIVILDPTTGNWTYKPDYTFSTLLIGYSDPNEMDPIRFRTVERPFPMTFVPL